MDCSEQEAHNLINVQHLADVDQQTNRSRRRSDVRHGKAILMSNSAWGWWGGAGVADELIVAHRDTADHCSDAEGAQLLHLRTQARRHMLCCPPPIVGIRQAGARLGELLTERRNLLETGKGQQ